MTSTVQPAVDASSTGESTRVSACTACGGSAFKKYSLIFSEQRTTGTTDTAALGVGLSASGGLGVGIGGAKAKSVQVTDLALRVAPPVRSTFQPISLEPGKDGKVVVIAVAPSIVVWWFFGWWWAVGACVALLIVAISKFGIGAVDSGQERFDAAYAAWDKKFLCLQCGAELVAGAGGTFTNVALPPADPSLDALIRGGRTLEAVALFAKREKVGIQEARTAVAERTKLLNR